MSLNSNNRTISFDTNTHNLIKRLVKAQEESNRLKQQELNLLKARPVIEQFLLAGNEEGLDLTASGFKKADLEQEAKRESGEELAGLDQRFLEEAVAEGDNPEILGTSLPPRAFGGSE